MNNKINAFIRTNNNIFYCRSYLLISEGFFPPEDGEDSEHMKEKKNTTSIEPENQRFCGWISGGLDEVVEERLAVLVTEVDVAGVLLQGRILGLAGQRGDLVRLLGSLAGGEGEHGEGDRDGEAQRSGVRRRHCIGKLSETMVHWCLPREFWIYRRELISRRLNFGSFGWSVLACRDVFSCQ